MDLLDWAKRFVSTPSVSRDGNAAMAEVAAELLREAGLEPRLIPAEHEGVRHFTVIADAGPAPGPRVGDLARGDGDDRPAPAGPHAADSAPGDGLLLLTHLDTVPPGPGAAWTETGGEPFRPCEKGDKLYGLGSADAKVDLVCKAAAIAATDRSALCRPLRIVGTFAEEIGLVGARWLVRGGYTKGYRFALVGEPSELVGIRAHKGYAVFEARIPLAPVGRFAAGGLEELSFSGETAHSSTPHLGRNAISAAVARLACADVGGVVNLIGGGAVNKVPDQAAVTIVRKSERSSAPIESGASARPSPAGSDAALEAHDPAKLLAFFSAWRANLEALHEPADADFDPAFTVGNIGAISLEGGVCRVRFDLRPVPGVDLEAAVEPLRAHAEIELVRCNPSLATPQDGTLVRTLRAAQASVGLPERISTKATCTEAGLLAEAGLEVVVMGAGRSVGNVHRPNEHTFISQLAQARDVYAHVIRRLCIEDAACSC